MAHQNGSSYYLLVRDTKATGERSEAQVLAALLKLEKTVLLPFGDNQRYDLVIEEGGNFLKVQCKTGRIRKGAVRFNASSTTYKNGRRSYVGEVDFFGVYCPDNDKTYLIPVGDVPKVEAYLRVEQPKNNQVKNILLAEGYELR